MTYKIGTYKNGQQIANEVFASNNIEEIKSEFKMMFFATIEDCWEEAVDNEWDDETLDGVSFEDAWKHKHFSEDTNNVAVFSVENGDGLHTNYTYQGCASRML